mgnify:CR=1 FL=1
MTQEDFAKKRWQHSEAIEYSLPGHKAILCMLVGLDFENNLMRLWPFDQEIYKDESFWARVEYCRRPLRIIK